MEATGIEWFNLISIGMMIALFIVEIITYKRAIFLVGFPIIAIINLLAVIW